MTVSAAPAQAEPVLVDAKSLPVFCPNPAMPLWSSHPRVYLELDAHGETRCPSCGTRYQLAGGARPAH